VREISSPPIVEPDRSDRNAVGVQRHDEELQLLDEIEGTLMLYSSGTTGRPKGIVRPITGQPFGAITGVPPSMEGQQTGNLVQLCSGPLCHAAPLTTSMLAHRLGGTVVVMKGFDLEEVLRLVDTHRVTSAQFVPTMFARLLKLAPEVRARYDLNGLQYSRRRPRHVPSRLRSR